MCYKEITAEGIWIIPAERYKTKRPHFVPLSKAALALIEAQQKFNDCDYVFASSVKKPFSRSGRSRRALDKAILKVMQKRATNGAKVEPIPNWTLHDLRRTAKTLMARAGVRPDISERVLGHVIAGVEGTYDRHSYADEKRDALEKLATMIERILNPLPSNVETLGERRASVVDEVEADRHGRTDLGALLDRGRQAFSHLARVESAWTEHHFRNAPAGGGHANL